MKKAVLSMLSVIAFVIIPKALFAGFYSDIANKIDDFETKLFTIELAEITQNGKYKIGCLKDLSLEDIKNIVKSKDENISLIREKVDSSCLDSNGGIATSFLLELKEILTNIYNNSLTSAKQKTEQLMQLDSIGIYADGIEENAPFDLILDLKKIDDVIFEQEGLSYSYEGTKYIDLSDKINSKFLDALSVNGGVFGPDGDGGFNGNLSSYLTEDDYTSPNPELTVFTPSNSFDIYSQNMCTIEDSLEASGLSEEELLAIAGLNGENLPGPNGDGTLWGDDGIGYNNDYQITPPSGNYRRVNDNLVFPCTTFFCIDIKVITYNQSLLGGGQGLKTPTIEFLVNRSNNHIKPFTKTSLVQSKMTVNNFELGLKDLNLPDIFSLKFDITKKPVPILDVVKNEEVKKGGQFELEEMMKTHYSNLGLDYTRQNDLSILNRVSEDRMNTENALYQSITKAINETEKKNDNSDKKVEEEKIFIDLIKTNAKSTIMESFNTQFTELERFNKWIGEEYVTKIVNAITRMKKIP